MKTIRVKNLVEFEVFVNLQLFQYISYNNYTLILLIDLFLELISIYYKTYRFDLWCSWSWFC